MAYIFKQGKNCEYETAIITLRCHRYRDFKSFLLLTKLCEFQYSLERNRYLRLILGCVGVSSTRRLVGSRLGVGWELVGSRLGVGWESVG